jgi:hypothetical protein
MSEWVGVVMSEWVGVVMSEWVGVAAGAYLLHELCVV